MPKMFSSQLNLGNVKLYKISVQYNLVGVFTILICFYDLQYSQTYLTKENVGIKCFKESHLWK